MHCAKSFLIQCVFSYTATTAHSHMHRHMRSTSVSLVDFTFLSFHSILAFLSLSLCHSLSWKVFHFIFHAIIVCIVQCRWHECTWVNKLLRLIIVHTLCVSICFGSENQTNTIFRRRHIERQTVWMCDVRFRRIGFSANENDIGVAMVITEISSGLTDYSIRRSRNSFLIRWCLV